MKKRFQLGYAAGWLLMSILVQASTAYGSPCTSKLDHNLNYTLSINMLPAVCTKFSIGCEVIEEHNSLSHIYATLGSTISFILPIESAAGWINYDRTYTVRRLQTSFAKLAEDHNVHEGELRALNYELYGDEWRGPDVALFKTDRIKLPTRSSMLRRYGELGFSCN